VKSYVSVLLIGVAACALSWPAAGRQAQNAGVGSASQLTPPKGNILVAFVLTEGSVMIDFAGPWEVFQDVHVPSRGTTMEEQMPFRLYTVSDTKQPIQISGGMQIVPDYTFDGAPQPKVVVVPAQAGRSTKMLEWIRKMSKQSDVVMSVCTGAFVLGEAGVLNGKKATTHHGSYARFQRKFPEVTLVRGMRYVQSDRVILTAGGLSSGIDLALHVVELYYGRTVAEATARHMEYEGQGWKGDGSAGVNFTSSAQGAYPSDGLSSGVLGNWQGTLEATEGSYLVLVHLWRDKEGKLAGAVDSPDEEDANGLVMSAISQNGAELHFKIAQVDNAFDGKINPEGSTISGTWKMRHGTRPIALTRVTMAKSN
jgi:putative intracellular protease/amidase